MHINQKAGDHFEYPDVENENEAGSKRRLNFKERGKIYPNIFLFEFVSVILKSDFIMDPSKRDTLIQWINAINPLETIESLQELRDGEQLISLLSTITSNSYSNLLTRKERFEVVQKFIEDSYNYDFSGQVNFDRDNELDFAKVLVLVLSVGVQGEHQEQLMTPALSLDQRSQVEIMNILKEIVSDCPNKLNLDNLLACRSEDTFDSTDVSCHFSPEKTHSEEQAHPASIPSKAELQNRSTSTSSLTEIMSPFQRINVGFSPASTTPLHSLITSTGFSSRIIQRERNLRRKAENEIEEKNKLLKKLTSDLNTERHLRSDIELEIQEKIKTINSKSFKEHFPLGLFLFNLDDKIHDLMTQNRTLKQLQDKLDELNMLKEEYEQMVTETEKSKSYVEELKDLRLQNSSLKKEVNELYEEINSLKEMKIQFKILQLDCNKYIDELQKEEKKCASLQTSLDLKQKAVDDAVNSKNFTEDNLTKMKEMYEDMKRQYEELLAFQSVNEPSGERMTVITDQLMDELKKELDDLKNTWITPSTHEELKIKLANIVTERDSFESKSLKLCEEVLQVQSDNDLLKKKNEDFEIELEKCQRHLQDSQRNIEKLTANLEAFNTRETQWHQTEMKYKTELQQLQTKLGQMQMELSCVSTELKLANAQLESDFKSSELRRQTLVQSVSELRNEKKVLEQNYEADKVAVEEKAKGLKSQLETLKMEFASREQELSAQNESVAMERQELEQQLETERRLRDNMERNLTSQHEEVENELNETICQLKEDLKAAEEDTQRLRSQLREKIDEYDGQVESLTNFKFELQAKVNKLESQASLDKQERFKLQAEVKNSGEQVEELMQNIGKLTERLNKSIAEKKDCQEKLQDVEKKLELAFEESQHWMTKNSSDKKTFEVKIMALEKEQAKFAESNRCAMEELSDELRSSLDENCKLKSQLQKQTDLLTDTRAELEVKVQYVEGVQEQLSQLQKLHHDLQQQNCLLNNNLVMTQSQLACKESEVTDLERKIDELSDEKICLVESHEKELGATRQALSQEIVNLNEQIESSKSTLLGFVEQVVKVANPKFSTDNLNSSLYLGELVESVGKDIFHTVEDQSKRLTDAEERCTSQETQLSQLQENLQVKLQEGEMLKEDLKEMRAHSEQLQALKDKQQQQLEENDALIKNLEEAKASLDSQILSERESFQARLDEASTECNTTRQSLEEKTSCIVEMKQQLDKNDTLIKSLEETKANLDSQILSERESFQAKLDDTSIECNTTRQLVEEKTAYIVELKEQLDKNDALIKSLEETKARLDSQILSERESFQARLDDASTECNTTRQLVEEKTAYIAELKEQSIMLDNELKSVHQEVGQLEAARNELQQRKKETEDELAEKCLQLEVAAQKTSEMTVLLTDKDSLIESQSEIQNRLEESLASLNQKVAANDLEINVLNSDLAQKDLLIKEKNSELEELSETLEQNKRQLLELVEEHETAITALQQEVMLDYEAKLDAVVADYENNICENYVGQSTVNCLEEKHKIEIEELRVTLEQERKDVLSELREDHEASINALKHQFATQLSTEYIKLEDAQEQNQKHFLEVEQLQKAVKEYQTKMDSREQEYKESLERVVLEYKEKIANDFVPSSVFDEQKEQHLTEITRVQNELTADHEKKVQLLTEEHAVSLKQLMCSYEENLINEYVPRQTVEEEKENLVLETRKNLEVEMQEKTAALQQEHEALLARNEQQFQEMLTENYIEKSALAEKEKELSQQRAEFDLIVATSENVKEQHEASVKSYELRVSELEEKLGQQEMHIGCLEEQVVNEKFDGERQTNEVKRALEGQLTEMKKLVDIAQQDLATAVDIHKAESDQLRAQISLLEKSNQDEATRLTENYQRDFEQMKQEYQAKIVELDATYKAELNQQKECHLQEMCVSHAKYEEIQQNLVSTQSKAEEAVSLKEQELKEILADTEKQLNTEKSLIEKKLTDVESEFTEFKANHKLVLESNEEKIANLNSCISKLREEYRMNQSKCDLIERQLREREQKLIMDNMKTLSKAEEMNKSLSNQLQVAQKEVSLAQKKKEATQKEVDSLTNDLKLVKQMKQKAVNELQEYKIHCLELKENFSSEKSQLEKNIQEIKEQNLESHAEIENLNKLIKHYKTREEIKFSKFMEQRELDKKSIEKLTSKISALEQEKKSMTDYLKKEEEKFKAFDKENRTLHRKVSDLTEQLEKAGNALFDSNNHDFDLPNDSLDSPDIKEITRRTYELRSKSGIWNRMKVEDYNISPVSCQSRGSISSYKSVASNVSSTSKTPIPPGCGQIFSCEDEPTTFDWGRITEIRRRNTMVPAHLRSTYPAELQNIPNSINEEMTKPSAPGSGKRKRKSPVSKTQAKEIKDRPATPGRLRRLRIRTNLNNENSPQSDKKRLRTLPTPQKKPEYTGRPSMAFEISNTPKLSKRRQKGRSTIFQMSEPKREPLKPRNCHQTNL
ncbi:GOLGB1 [Acanthosepion pharaonis]|uniref:GOLGB1 n=1 Tax=Acanthosepion pharaonis TaxID=158019 RepID=A0A812BKB2_ACAPH|nr:GOLGB1 [Sepia pharaonis]